MTRDIPSFAVFIIGTGRSGTSLATQALDRLGLLMPDDQVPANENNLCGTGESIAVRNQTAALSEALGGTSSLLPSDWQSSPAGQKTSAWIETYLTRQRETAQGTGFVIKFPMASIFLPLWKTAAARVRLDLRFIWATRNLADTRQSLMRSYNQSESTATLRIAQRCFYILRDAPPDTLLLPYEGWTTAPEAQVAALADLTGVADSGLRENAASAFSAILRRSTSDTADTLPAALSLLKGVIHAKRGRLDEILPAGTVAYDRLCIELADLVENVRPEHHPVHALDAMNARLSLISKLAAAPDTETTQMKEELEILTKRIREVNAKNTELEQQMQAGGSAVQKAQKSGAYPAPHGEMKAAESERTNEQAARHNSKRLIAELRAEVKDILAERDRLAQEDDAQNISATAQDIEFQSLKSAYAALTREKDALEEDVTARSYDTVRTLELTEARHRTNSANYQKRLSATIIQLKAAEDKLAICNEQQNSVAKLEKQHRTSSADYQKRLNETGIQLKAAKNELEIVAVQLGDLQSKFEAVIEDSSKKNSELTFRLGKMTKHRDALLSSTSWRLTSPMRRVVRLVRNKW